MSTSVIQPELTAAWHLGVQRRRVFILGVLATVMSLVAALLILMQPILSPIIIVTWLVCIAIAWWPRIGLMTGFGLVLLFEPGGADAMMLPGAYLHGSLSSIGLNGVIASPLELLLILTFTVWLGRGIARRNIDFRGGSLGRPMLLFVAAMVLGLVRGAIGGGDLNIALWESRFLFYVAICYVLAANTIRTRTHFKLLIGIALVAQILYAIEGAYRRVALIDTQRLGVIIEFAYSHEVVIFLGVALLLPLAVFALGGTAWMRVLSLVILPIGGFTLLATERRAGYIAVIIAFAALAVVLFQANRKAFYRVAIPLVVIGAIYLPLFWNASGMAAQPARAVRSLSQPDPRDAASNLYRALEKLNVSATIRSDPLLGVGFGRPFLFEVAMPDLSWWPFWRYEPHHNILWVWLKTGAFGFIAFFALMGLAIAKAASVCARHTVPDARIFAAFALMGVIATLTFCYVDLGLTSGRVTVFLGTLLGGLAVLDDIRA